MKPERLCVGVVVLGVCRDRRGFCVVGFMGRCLRVLGFRSWSAGFETGDIALQPGDALVCLRPRTIGQLFQSSAQRGDLPLCPRYQSLCGIWFCHRLVGFLHGLGGVALEPVYAHSTRRAMPPNPPNEPIPASTSGPYVDLTAARINATARLPASISTPLAA